VPRCKDTWANYFKGLAAFSSGAHENGIATVELFRGGKVPALIWEITLANEKALDHYEGYPILYCKESVRVKLGGKEIEAMLYLLKDGHPPAQPSLYYCSMIFDGYKAQGFDVQILRRATLDSRWAVGF